MKSMYEYGMHTSFDTLKEDMTIAEVPGYSGEFRDRACFAPLRDMLLRYGHAKEPVNDPVRYVKNYPWIHPELDDVKGYMEAVQQYLDVMFSIPFVQERVLEYTGYGRNTGRGDDVDESKYFLVDMKTPVDEGFCILQMLRVPQEFPGQIKTFHDTLKKTENPRLAFLAALAYMNSRGDQCAGGHHPTNGISYKWAAEFLKDPGFARSIENKWNSNVIGGGSHAVIRYEDFVAGLSGGDPCTIPVAVYGSLREGLGNYRLLDKALKEKRARSVGVFRECVPAKMYSLGGFPALHPTHKRHPITFELFQVNSKTLSELDALEGYPHFYDRTQIILDGAPYWVYYHHNQPSDTVVESGDWKEYVKQSKIVHPALRKEVFA